MTKRAFIENDHKIGGIEKSLCQMLTHEHWDTAFECILSRAAQKPQLIWQIILAYNEIYISSRLSGESGNLLLEMIQKAIENGVRNKKIINLARKRDVEKILTLEMEHQLAIQNIIFYFADDILEELNNQQ